mgnify:CR=1 FL=1
MAYPTNPIYKLVKNIDNEIKQVKKMSNDNTHTMFIPFATDNKHYQEYLDWVAEGNTAEAAD